MRNALERLHTAYATVAYADDDHAAERPVLLRSAHR